MKKTSLILVLLIGFGGISFAQTATIGTQVWMTKNLDVSTFRNGDHIPEAKTPEQWEKETKKKKPIWCFYQNNPDYGFKYGKLYNWYAVNDPRGLAPEGYRVPSDQDWTTLSSYLGGEEVAGNAMKSIYGWNENGYSTNSSGFLGLPGGHRTITGKFFDIGKGGNWWSSTEDGTGDVWVRTLYYNIGFLVREGGLKEGGFSVRCVKDELK
jgi:uncharacterized protein (TIGR02145 family)